MTEGSQRSVRPPDAAAIALARAGALLDLDRDEQAAATAGTVLAADPGNTAAALIVAQAMLKLGRIDDAAVLAERALSVEPDNLDALTVAVWACQTQGRHDDAMSLAQRLMQLDEGSGPIGVYAAALLGARRLDEARTAAAQLLRLEPDDVDSPLLMAKIEMTAARPEAAALALRDALAIQPDHLEAQELLALTQRHAPARTEATVGVARSLAQHPDDTAIPVVLEALLSRLLLTPAVIALLTCAAALGTATIGSGLFGVHLPSNASPAACTVLQALVVAGGLIAVAVWASRIPPEQRGVLTSALRMQADAGGFVLLTGWFLITAAVFAVVGVVLTTWLGDPVGPVALTGALYAAAAATILAALMTFAIRHPAAGSVLLVVATALAAVGIGLIVAMIAVGFVFAVIYIVVYAILPKGWLPDLFPPDREGPG